MSENGQEPTFVDAAHLAGKRTLECAPARLHLTEELIITTRGSEPERRHRSGSPDHFVGLQQDRLGNRDAKSSCSLEVDYELVTR